MMWSSSECHCDIGGNGPESLGGEMLTGEVIVHAQCNGNRSELTRYSQISSASWDKVKSYRINC